MTQEEMKIECLRLSDGDMSDAKKFYEWIMGHDQVCSGPVPTITDASTLIAQNAEQSMAGREFGWRG